MAPISKKIHGQANHRYELTVIVRETGNFECWSIDANTRSQAGAIAKRNGASEVHDCNMVG